MKPQAIIIKVTMIIAKVTMKKKLLSINSRFNMEFGITSRDTLHTKDTTYKTVIMQVLVEDQSHFLHAFQQKMQAGGMVKLCKYKRRKVYLTTMYCYQKYPLLKLIFFSYPMTVCLARTHLYLK